MIFDESFVKSLPDDWAEAILKIHERFDDSLLGDTAAKYCVVRETWAFLHVYSQVKELPRSIPDLTGPPPADITRIVDVVRNLRALADREIKKRSDKDELKHYVNVFEIALRDTFHYEFSEGDLNEIQGLLNELREMISKSAELEEDHRHRLLRKLEKLQSEWHKKVSDLDRFWGFCIDASIVVGLMGENAKPMIDVIQKIARIVRPAQARAYELPSDFQFKLPGQSDDDKSEND